MSLFIMILPIVALLSGVALLLLGTGLLNSVLALRGGLEGFSDIALGLMGSAYFLGFFLGTFLAPSLIQRIGHIRAFAFFGACIAGTVLAHALAVHPVFWILLRVVTGIALVGFYSVIESWLNSQAPPSHRGQIFALYMAVNLGALALAQQLLNLASPATFTLFALAALLVCLALLPVTATRLPQPVMEHRPRLPLRQLQQAAPLACAGALLSGLAMGGFWGMGAVYGLRLGFDESGVAFWMTAAILGGACGQWPLGRLSDCHDRRLVLAGAAVAAALAAGLMLGLGAQRWGAIGAAFLFGMAAFAVYPIVVAHLIDHLPQDEILSGNVGLLLLHGVGAAIGPALAGLLMNGLGPMALPLQLLLLFAALALTAWHHTRKGQDRIVEEPAQFMPMVRTSAAVLDMMTPEPQDSEDSLSGARY